MISASRIASAAVAAIVSLAAGTALGEEARATVRTKDSAGFSEIAVPQVTGTLPIRRTPTNTDQKPFDKTNSSQAPNQPINCGPENAQSVACQKVTR